MGNVLEVAAKISKALAAGISAAAGAYGAAEVAGSVGLVELVAVLGAGLVAFAFTFVAPKNA